MNTKTKVLKNLARLTQVKCYAIFIHILTLISPFSNLLARCFHALFACCDCVFILVSVLLTMRFIV